MLEITFKLLQCIVSLLFGTKEGEMEDILLLTKER